MVSLIQELTRRYPAIPVLVIADRQNGANWLECDSHWQRLPVLFLSALQDDNTQNQAFAVGADDYLCKPVTAVDLANRILNRLQRVRAWAS